MSELFAAGLLEGLNLPQRKAVTHGEGPLLVLAGPGSGKTTVIVRRIQYLIGRMHVPPEEILVITFTKEAARSMQQRFGRQSVETLPVNFGTFHSVFYHIILKSSHYSDPRQFNILTETRKRELIIPILKEIKQRADGGCYTPDNMASDAGEMLTAISYYKNTGDEGSAVRGLSGDWKAHFREALTAYQCSTRENGALDFDDMVFECRRLLEQDVKLRLSWQKRFSHILIDEFQDINPMQYQVIKLLTREPFNLFAVGDDDQAIYGFRGSDPACLRCFAEEYNAKRVLLNVNYRSRPEIVEAAGRVIKENNMRYQKELFAASEVDCTAGLSAGSRPPEKETHVIKKKGEGCQPAVRILHFQEREQQNAYLREGIAEFLKRNPQGSCAVLFRTNLHMQSFAAGLSRAGIAYHMRERAGNIYEHFVARDVTAYLRLGSGERNRALFLQIMNKPSRFLRRDALADMEYVDFERMKQWYGALEDERGRACRNAIERLQGQLNAMRGMTPYLAVQFVCRAVGYESWLREQASGFLRGRRQDWPELLEWLKEDAGGYGTVADWLEAQRRYAADAGREEKGPAKCPEKEPLGKGVQLMTVHAAKGLEFDHVWIPDCNEKNFPHGDMLDRESVEEERRIFYVGMTRAKSSLELLWLTGTRERPRLMSRFLNPIVGDHSSSSPISSSNSQLSRYSSKASATFSYSSSSSM